MARGIRQRRFVFGAIAAAMVVILAGMSPASAANVSEQQGSHGANTFADYHNASGMGPRVNAATWVSVSCKVYDPTIASVNPDGYWYRIASPPWDDQYYAAANTFMNGDPWGGPYTHNTDFSVPDCGSTPPPPPTPMPSVSLSRGPAAPSGFRYAVTLSGFAASSGVSIECYDVASPNGFFSFTLTTNGSGTASTEHECYSDVSGNHWVVANGSVRSNLVNWGSIAPPPDQSSSGGRQSTPPPSTTPARTSAPTGPSCPAPAGSRIPNSGWIWYSLYDHYMWDNGSDVMIDWSFFAQRHDFVSFATALPADGSEHAFTAPKSDVDLYLSLRSFTVIHQSNGCYSIYDHYDFTPTSLAQAAADEPFSGEKALTDLLFLPEWAYQLSGAREFNINAGGAL